MWAIGELSFRCTVTDPFSEECAMTVELLDAVVAGIGHVNFDGTFYFRQLPAPSPALPARQTPPA
jgi:hypothetical protein